MEHYGSDFITITDEDGVEYELEVLDEFEFRGNTYLAVIPAGAEEASMDVSLLRQDMEDGEPVLSAILDNEELDAVHQAMMDRLYADGDAEEE